LGWLLLARAVFPTLVGVVRTVVPPLPREQSVFPTLVGVVRSLV